MGCGCAGGTSLTGVGVIPSASGCSNECNALRLLNERIGNVGILTTDCQLLFETHVFIYKVTFNGFTQYKIARQEKGFLDLNVVGTGMTITQAANAIPDYGPFLSN